MIKGPRRFIRHLALVAIVAAVHAECPRLTAKETETYSKGDHFYTWGARVDIEDEKYFSYTEYSDLGGQNHTTGTIVNHGQWMELDELRETIFGVPISKRMYRVSWGERRYLIPDDCMLSFVTDINSGSEPRTSKAGMFFLRADDWLKPVTGTPEIPAEYRKLILKAPVTGQITGILPNDCFKLDIEIPELRFCCFEVDLGTTHGLVAEMGLVITPHESPHPCLAHITKISETTCTVSVAPCDQTILVGDHVSSRR